MGAAIVRSTGRSRYRVLPVKKAKSMVVGRES